MALDFSIAVGQVSRIAPLVAVLLLELLIIVFFFFEITEISH